MRLLACSSPSPGEPRFEGSADVMHGTARLSEIDCFESRRRPSDGSEMPLCFLNEMEQRVALPIGLRQSRREPPLKRDKCCDQVTVMVDRACRRAQAFQAVGGFGDAFASGVNGFAIDEPALASDCALQQVT